VNAPPTSAQVNFSTALNMALDEALASDDRVILLGEDIADRQGGGVMKVTKGLSTKYGEKRVRTTPISEQAIVGAAVGAALAGMRPVAEIMLMNFMTVAMDQLVNHAAKMRFMSGGQTGVPLTIRTMSGAGRGFAGQHSDMLEAWFAHVPGLKVVTASSPADAKGLLQSCILDDDPCIFVEHIADYWTMGTAPSAGYVVPLGRANVVKAGSDVTVISYGKMVADALTAANKLEAQGVSVEIVDLRTVAPFDAETILASVAKTRRAVIAHEAVRNFGVGAEIAALIQEEIFDELKAPVRRLGGKFCPVPFSPALEATFMPNSEDIVTSVLSTLESRRS